VPAALLFPRAGFEDEDDDEYEDEVADAIFVLRILAEDRL